MFHDCAQPFIEGVLHPRFQIYQMQTDLELVTVEYTIARRTVTESTFVVRLVHMSSRDFRLLVERKSILHHFANRIHFLKTVMNLAFAVAMRVGDSASPFFLPLFGTEGFMLTNNLLECFQGLSSTKDQS